MPVSLPIFDEEIELYFRHAPVQSVLDIGPGEGKYGKMLRRVRPAARLVGVEIDESYVQQYRLRELYDDVWVQDAARLMDEPAHSFDAVIIGDCLEHMRKSVGTDLLHFLVYRAKIIILKFPVQMIQNAWHGHASEAHVSVWDERDFAPFDCLYQRRDIMRLALIRGYLNRQIEWLPAEVMRRFGYESVTAYYDQLPERWKLADQETLRRRQSVAELAAVIPADARFILVDECQSGLAEEFPGRTIPFCEKDGQYWGLPADDAAAITEVERQRGNGAAFIVFAYPTLWAVNHYRGLMQHLRQHNGSALANERLITFSLQNH